ncbi:MAG: DoxX family protein [Planctomycetota bacterium]
MSDNKAWAEDTGKLLLRVAVGGLMLFHGIFKLQHGIAWMNGMLTAKGLPTFLAYGAYVGEVVAPILILIGLLTRPSAVAVAGTMIMAVYLAMSDQIFKLTPVGGWALELNAFYFLGALAVMLLGPGKYSVSRGRSWWG